MYFIAGYRMHSNVLNEKTMFCSNCKRDTVHSFLEIIKKMHFFFIPLFTFSRRYALQCNVCGLNYGVPTHQGKQLAKHTESWQAIMSHIPGSGSLAPRQNGGQPSPAMQGTMPIRSMQGPSQFSAPNPVIFILLSLATAYIYPLYWFYKNWKFIKAKELADFSAGGRTIFIPYFFYHLAQKAFTYGQQKGYNPAIPAGGLAGIYIASLLLATAYPRYLLFFLAINLASFIPLLQAMRKYNEV